MSGEQPGVASVCGWGWCVAVGGRADTSTVSLCRSLSVC